MGNNEFQEPRAPYQYGVAGHGKVEQVIDRVFTSFDEGYAVEAKDRDFIERNQLNNRNIIYNDFKSRVLSVKSDTSQITHK